MTRSRKVWLIVTIAAGLAVALFCFNAIKTDQQLRAWDKELRILKDQVGTEPPDEERIKESILALGFSLKSVTKGGMDPDITYFEFESPVVDHFPPFGRTPIGVLLLSRTEIMGELHVKKNKVIHMHYQLINTDAF